MMNYLIYSQLRKYNWKIYIYNTSINKTWRWMHYNSKNYIIHSIYIYSYAKYVAIIFFLKEGIIQLHKATYIRQRYINVYKGQIHEIFKPTFNKTVNTHNTLIDKISH